MLLLPLPLDYCFLNTIYISIYTNSKPCTIHNTQCSHDTHGWCFGSWCCQQKKKKVIVTCNTQHQRTFNRHNNTAIHTRSHAMLVLCCWNWKGWSEKRFNSRWCCWGYIFKENALVWCVCVCMCHHSHGHNVYDCLRGRHWYTPNKIVKGSEQEPHRMPRSYDVETAIRHWNVCRRQCCCILSGFFFFRFTFVYHELVEPNNSFCPNIPS